MSDKKIRLFSKDKKLATLLEAIKERPKYYSKLENGLKTLGSFDGKYEINLYSEAKDKNDELIIKVWITDDTGSIFVFNLITPNKNDMLKIEIIMDEEELTYDFSLTKNFMLSKENIELIRCDKIYNFKFGRLVTDLKSFYTIFLSDNIGYQIKGNFSIDIKDELLLYLNSMENLPKMMEYINIFDMCLKAHKATFDTANIIAFKDMNVIEQINFKGENQKVYTNIKKTAKK